jgi:hypothetical protein
VISEQKKFFLGGGQAEESQQKKEYFRIFFTFFERNFLHFKFNEVKRYFVIALEVLLSRQDANLITTRIEDIIACLPSS